MTTTTNDNLGERLTALAERYADKANWRAVDDDDGLAFVFAYGRYRLAVYGVPLGYPWLPAVMTGWVWAIEPGDWDDWVLPESDRDWPTAAEAKADALTPLIRLIFHDDNERATA